MKFVNEVDLLMKIQCSIYLTCKAKCYDKYSVIVPKCKQMECLKQAVKEVDVIAFALFANRLRKSLIYEVMPYVEEVCRNKSTSAVLVVTPLNAIIDDHEDILFFI